MSNVAITMRLGLRALAFVVGLGVTSMPAQAQQKPDFSGRWALTRTENPAATPAARLEVVHAQDPRRETLTVTAGQQGGTRTRVFEIGRAGGRVAGVDSSGRSTGPSSWYSVTWVGEMLLIEEGTSAWQTQREQSFKEVWSIDSGGALTITVIVNGGDQVNIARYRREAK